MLTLSGTSTLSLDNNTQMLLDCGVLFTSFSLFLRSKSTQFGPDWFGWVFFFEGCFMYPIRSLKQNWKTQLEIHLLRVFWVNFVRHFVFGGMG